MTLRTITYDDAHDKLVPREPNQGMCDAAYQEYIDWFMHSDGEYANRSGYKRIYKAMLAAAPDTLPGVIEHSGDPVAMVTDGTTFGPGLAFLANGKDFPKRGALLYTHAAPAQPVERSSAADERMRHDYPILQQFHAKHALGGKAAPSCLCCGQQTHPITRPINEAWHRAAKEIIDRWVAPDMYGQAMAMLELAMKAACGNSHAQPASAGLTDTSLLSQCKEKLTLYREKYGGEYVGGVEFTDLIARIDRALLSAAQRDSQPATRPATDEEIQAWADRYELNNVLKSEKRAAFEDAATLHLTFLPAQASQPVADTSADARDAARYRWLRKRQTDEFPMDWDQCNDVQIDAAIDAAIAASREAS